MFNAVSTSGTANPQIKIGLTTPEITGYTSQSTYQGGSNQCGVATITTGFPISLNTAASNTFTGIGTICNLTGNTWVYSGVYSDGQTFSRLAAGVKTTSGVINIVSITTTDTFDAGTINISYE
jgi:hypothetical protein